MSPLGYADSKTLARGFTPHKWCQARMQFQNLRNLGRSSLLTTHEEVLRGASQEGRGLMSTNNSGERYAPGRILRRTVLDPTGLTTGGLARHLGITPKNFQAVTAGRRLLGVAQSIRLSRAVGRADAWWSLLQSDHLLALEETQELCATHPDLVGHCRNVSTVATRAREGHLAHVPHPGLVLAGVLSTAGMTQSDFAKHTRLCRRSVSWLVLGRRSLVIETAWWIAAATETDARDWVHLQACHAVSNTDVQSVDVHPLIKRAKARAANGLPRLDDTRTSAWRST